MFTIEEVTQLCNLLVSAHEHSIKTTNMAYNDAIQKINSFIAQKQSDQTATETVPTPDEEVTEEDKE